MQCAGVDLQEALSTITAGQKRHHPHHHHTEFPQGRDNTENECGGVWQDIITMTITMTITMIITRMMVQYLEDHAAGMPGSI